MPNYFGLGVGLQEIPLSGGGGVITPSPPVNVTPPVIVGDPHIGATLTVTNNGGWAGYPAPAYTYQWFQAPATLIVGATNSTYVVQPTDETFNIFSRVTATNSEGNANADSNQIGPILAPETRTLEDGVTQRVVEGASGASRTLE